MKLCEWLTRKRQQLSTRRGRRVTQTEVAEAAGISRQYLSFLESGVYPTPGKVLERELVLRLAQALEADEREAEQAAGFGIDLTDEEREILRRYRKLSGPETGLVRQLLETLAPRPWAEVSEAGFAQMS
jgi:transcriptional regulator with XRE-family HTH domain